MLLLDIFCVQLVESMVQNWRMWRAGGDHCSLGPWSGRYCVTSTVIDRGSERLSMLFRVIQCLRTYTCTGPPA